MNLQTLESTSIRWSQRAFLPLARFSLFFVYFYFGILKVFDLSPASPLAVALTSKTIGAQYFDTAFMILAVFECLLGILFLFPKLWRIVVPLFLIHMAVVCSPLIMVPNMAWDKLLVPSLEGQYIIKNIVLISLVVGIVSYAGRKKKA